jgi:hypothetical protein
MAEPGNQARQRARPFVKGLAVVFLARCFWPWASEKNDGRPIDEVEPMDPLLPGAGSSAPHGPKSNGKNTGSSQTATSQRVDIDAQNNDKKACAGGSAPAPESSSRPGETNAD